VSTADDVAYAARLYRIGNRSWKRALNPVNPYRLHIRSLAVGRCLDVGCGFGRNLGYLRNSSNVGVEPNASLRTLARELGHTVIAPEDVQHSLQREEFDNLIFSHVLEHLLPDQHPAILNNYLPYLKSGGRVIVRIPQRAGFDSDDDHRHFWTLDSMQTFLESNHLTISKKGTFPFPELGGTFFKYNEWFLVATKQ